LKCFQTIEKIGQIKMNIIYATYNVYHNSIDIYTYAGYFLRIDCSKAEEWLKTTPCSECAFNALAIDKPFEYAKLYLEGGMQTYLPIGYKGVNNPWCFSIPI